MGIKSERAKRELKGKLLPFSAYFFFSMVFFFSFLLLEKKKMSGKEALEMEVQKGKGRSGSQK